MTCQHLKPEPGRRLALAVCAGLAAAVGTVVARGGEQTADPRTSERLLVLSNGDKLRGTLVPSEKSGQIAWQSSVLVSPLHFPLASVQSIKFNPRPSAPHGNYRVELTGGNELHGDIVSLDGNTVLVRTPYATLQVKRAAVASLSHLYRALRPRAGRPSAEQLARGKKEYVLLRNDKVVYAELAGYDPRSTAFSFRSGGETLSYLANDVVEIVMAEVGTKQDAVRLEYVDGTCLGGELESLGPASVVLRSSALREAVTMPLSGLRSIQASAHYKFPAHTSGEAVLCVGETRLRGRLVNAEQTGGQTCFAWQASGSSAPIAIRRGVTASIDFGLPGLSALVEEESHSEDRIFLRSGDVLTCQILSIDDAETAVRLFGMEPRRVRNERIKAVELGPRSRRALSDGKLSRLLTVPRLQKLDPPTHIAGSMNDDFLRGRLIAVTDRQVLFQVGRARREFPRERIASIVWLDATDPPPSEKAHGELVQATNADGLSLFLADARLDDGSLVGSNQLLGECRLRLEEVSDLRLGARPSPLKLTRSYQTWKLAQAIEPRAFSGDTGGADRGEASDLVGQRAADFTLELLDGTRFRLSSQRGRIVVLDFWASWCEPCVKGLPELASLAAEFDARQVQFIAVNLQETRDDVVPAVARLELSLPVAFDHDGRVAARYGAHSIPYTVVVDADGKIDRVFAGDGPHFVDELKGAITSALDALVADGQRESPPGKRAASTQ